MLTDIIGRHGEQNRLLHLLKSNQPELITVYGRRRIGKTFLIRNIYAKHICFEFSGLHNAGMKDQLEHFSIELSEHYNSPLLLQGIKSWLVAFKILGNYLDTLTNKKKKVVFIDEFPWLASPRSKFLTAFENFWNGYASRRKDLIVVICGSAASYMVKNVILNKGGLHNRITEKMRIMPFNLYETSLFLKKKGIKYTRYDIVQLYMSIGGIPHYLNKIEKGESVAQTVDRLCFSKDGFLVSEFDSIFISLFNHSHLHKQIVSLLAKSRKGYTRKAIIENSKYFSSGGTLTKILNELTESGFISQYTPYKGTIKQSLYRLTDEYSLFYNKFILGKKHKGEGAWVKFSSSQSYKTWCGYSFESLCLKHITQVKKAIGIDKIYTEQASWVEKGNKNNQGAQIDLLIDRADGVINLCEMKFHNEKFVLTKKYADEVKNKINVFRASSKTKKSIFPTFITMNGIEENSYSLELVQNSLTANALFKAD